MCISGICNKTGYQLDYEWVALFTMNIFISNPIHTEYMFSTYLYSSASLLDKEDAKEEITVYLL